MIVLGVGRGEVDGSVGIDVDAEIKCAIDGTTITMLMMEGEAVGKMNGSIADVGTTMIDGRIAAARRQLTFAVIVAPSSIECHTWRWRQTTQSILE
jgi:hypothetical protein